MLCGLLVVRFLRFENIRHELLWIAIVKREPGALHLDHDAMARLEDVVGGVQVDRERRNFIGRDRLGFFE